MARPQLQETATPHSPSRASATRRATACEPESGEYPVREYIAGMACELAQMARWDGDEVLAVLLEAAVARAEGPRPQVA